MTNTINQPTTPQFSPIIAGVMNWGTWGAQLTPQEVKELIYQCIDHGITTFDHADIYGHYTTETLFGDALASSSIRDRMQLISKCGIKLVTENRPDHKIKSYDTSKEHIIASVERSLKNLRTDYLDTLLIHRPSPLMHPEEIAEAFEKLQKSGKVRHFGVSNFKPSQVEMIGAYVPLVTNQIKVSVLTRTSFVDGTLDQCIQKKIRPMGYGPLAGGQLFSQTDDVTINSIRRVTTEIAEEHQATLDQILIAWVLQHPSKIIPIIGTTKMHRILSAQKALDIKLTREEWFMIWQAAEGKEVA